MGDRTGDLGAGRLPGDTCLQLAAAAAAAAAGVLQLMAKSTHVCMYHRCAEASQSTGFVA